MSMKKFWNYFLSMSIIASLFAVTSCEEDELPDVERPTFVIEGTDDVRETTVNVGETVDFQVNVNAPGGINTLVVNQTVGGSTVEYDRAPRPAGTPTTELTYDFEYTPGPEVAGETVIFDFVVVDDAGAETGSYDYTVIVPEQQVTTYQAVLLAAPTEDQTNEVWFSTSLGERFSTAEVNATPETISGEIDFGYRFGPSSGATLASPAQYPSEGGQNIAGWDERRETMLRRTTLSPDDFLEQGDNAQVIIDAYEAGTEEDNPQRLTQLQEGDVLAFRTDPEKAGGSRFGLIHVREINLGADGTGFGSDAFINLDVKVID
jgi:hypothetical protein